MMRNADFVPVIRLDRQLTTFFPSAWNNQFANLRNICFVHSSSLFSMADSTTDGKAGQVRIQLTTRHPDLELPDDPGPLLVSSGM